MRPVEKKNVGETVSYVNSKNQTITETIQEYYSPPVGGINLAHT